MVLRRFAAALVLTLIVPAFIAVPSCSGGTCNDEGCPCDYNEECARGDLPFCQAMICEDHACFLTVRIEGLPCEGGVCDGNGSCVECVQQRDCEPGRTCEPSHVCSTCEDGVQNGDETGVDCGGTKCPLCSGTCIMDADCGPPGGYCYQGLCYRCDDGIKNGDEDDVDCVWGLDGHCGRCLGVYCLVDEQCASGICGRNSACCSVPCGVCNRCEGPEGLCTPVSKGIGDPLGECPADQVCNGKGQCAWKTGHPCTSDNECAWQSCINGFCY